MNKAIINRIEYSEEDKSVLKHILVAWDKRFKLVKGNVVKRELHND